MNEPNPELHKGIEGEPPAGAELLEHLQTQAERRVQPGFPDDRLAKKTGELIHAENKAGTKPVEPESSSQVETATGLSPADDAKLRADPVGWVDETISKKLGTGTELHQATENLGDSIERNNKKK